MFTLPRPALRTSIGRLAITGAATLATVFAVAPVALAADEEPTTTEPSSEAPVAPDEVVVEPPVDETAPPSEGEAEKPSAADDTEKAEEADEQAEVQAVEPDFGVQKFRVGVKLADGRTDPSTVGSELRIVITDQADEEVDDFTCTTEESTVEDDSTASYCLFDEPIIDEDALEGLAQAARSRVDTSQGTFPDDQAIFLDPGETARITNTGAAPGLRTATQTGVVRPCEVVDFPPFCSAFDGRDFQSLFKPQSVVFTVGIPDGDVGDNGAENGNDDDALLPDTGGADPRLLGYAGLLMAGGTWLTLRGRRRADAVVD